MTSNMKLIFSAVGVAALLASPAMAKTNHHGAAPSETNVPANARGSASPYAQRPAVTPYGADVPQRAYETPGPSPDFQLGSEKGG